MHSFEVHSNESACRKSGHLGLEQVSKDFDSSTGFIFIHVIYDVFNDSCVTKSITEGLFEQTVTLHFAGGVIVDNPLFCLISAYYLTNTRLKESSLLTRATI